MLQTLLNYLKIGRQNYQKPITLPLENIFQRVSHMDFPPNDRKSPTQNFKISLYFKFADVTKVAEANNG